jgi:hypothetical protein
MNAISAISHRSEYANEPHLAVAIDSVPLDVILSTAYPELHLKGLVPTLLDWLRDERERRIVWGRILPPLGQSSLAPVLMCPDDTDLYCTTVIAEVIAMPTVIRWLRLGIDVTEGSSRPAGIGTVIDWLVTIGPYDFPRVDYERCLAQFRALNVKDTNVAT